MTPTAKQLAVLMVGLLMAGTAFGQPVPPTITNRVAHLPIPYHQVAVTNIELRWDKYTNAWFTIWGTTNMVDWYPVTNVFIGATNQFIPITKPNEFFRIETSVNIN